MDGDILVYKLMNTDDLSLEMTKKYYPMLTDQRKKKINDMESREKRTLAFCSEIIARQCLSKLFDAPEFAFKLLCNPDSVSVVGNFDASISIVHSGKYVACAASRDKVGICLVPVEPFSFIDAQKKFSDSEIRAIYADSGYSFSENIKQDICSEENVMQKYALFSSLKEAHFKSTGRGIRTDMRKIEFMFNGERLLCSDKEAVISVAIIDKTAGLAVSVIERK